MKLSELLRSLNFGNEAGEDEDQHVLESYFVEKEEFITLKEKEQTIRIITAKKGGGKSALLKWLKTELIRLNPSDLVIACRGSDLTRSEFGLQTSLNTPNEYIKDWQVRLCALANRRLAQDYFKVPVSDDQISLIETAELYGYKEKNLLKCLLTRLPAKLKQFSPDYCIVSNETEIFKRIDRPAIWFLIDDLDATFQNTNTECLELGAFFSAMRQMASDIRDVYFRVTLRTDVWPIIRKFDEALDKVEQYKDTITWTANDFRHLLYKRIVSNAENLSIQLPSRFEGKNQEEYEEYIITLIFEKRMEWNDLPRQPYKIIHTLSYHRPRWAIQLCKLSRDCALKYNNEKIDKPHIDAVWGEYGTRRIDDLIAEHKHQCESVRDLLLAFRGCERRMNLDALLLIIKNHILNHMQIILEGKRVTSPKEIAHYLYRIGFLQARSDSIDDGYSHYGFDEMPDLLNSPTTSDFSLLWEIHPCFREALDIKKLDESSRLRKGYIKPDKREFQKW